MRRYADVTNEIDTGPSGPDIAAFFDVDRTLYSRYSAQSFFVGLIRSGKFSVSEIVDAVAETARYRLGGTFKEFFEASAGELVGQSRDDLDEFGEHLFDQTLGQDVYPESRAIVKAHQRKGHTVVMITSATTMQVAPLADDLEIEHVLCNTLEVDADGLITGKAVEPIIYGPGKLDAAEAFAKDNDVDLDSSYFYSDGYEDLPLMERVGRPRPLNPDRKLSAIARRRGWPIQDFESRGFPSVSDLVRTGFALGSFFGAVGVAAPVFLMNRDKRATLDMFTGIFGDMCTALAGVDLHIEGEEHLWSNRPAVFIFNHQSLMDVAILARLLRGGFTGIAKKELKNTPVIGHVFEAAGVIFVDRANHAQAVHALEPAVDALKSGTSLIMAPEGHRQTTPRVGRFKKGAFHVAVQAGVPIVPILLRNPLDIVPRGRYVVHPASVDVVVHQPVSTDLWDESDLAPEIEKIRDWYVGNLDMSP